MIVKHFSPICVLIPPPTDMELGVIQQMGDLWDEKLGLLADKMCGRHEREAHLTMKRIPSDCIYYGKTYLAMHKVWDSFLGSWKKKSVELTGEFYFLEYLHDAEVTLAWSFGSGGFAAVQLQFSLNTHNIY